MATRDTPPDINCLNLENSATFSDYEVMIMVMKCIFNMVNPDKVQSSAPMQSNNEASQILLCPSVGTIPVY